MLLFSGFELYSRWVLLLNTLMDYNRILALDHGRVVEYDKPEILLQNERGYFSRLCRSYDDNADQ